MSFVLIRVGRSRGASLAAVCVLCAIALFLLLLALDVMINTYRRSARAESYEIAFRYASNAFQLAEAKLRENPEWGKNPATDVLKVPQLASDSAGSEGVVAFTTSTTNKDRSLSLNRFGMEPAPTATGLNLPENSVHIVAVGTHATVEGILAVNPFPFAIASTGPLFSSGPFLVGSLDDPAALDNATDLQKALKRGSVLSNAAGNSISFSGGPVHITGDVVCVGTANVGSSVTVDGEVKENRQPKPIPEFKLSDFDTAAKDGVRILETTHLTQPEAFEGYVRAAGDVQVDGKLDLSEAIVYVDGSLVVRGQLTGRGALFVTGDVTLESTSLGALDEVALISGGSLRITGKSKEQSRLAGLLVSKGDLSLSGVTVVGAVVAAGGPERQLRFDNASVYGSPKGLDFEFDLGWGRTTTFSTSGGGFSGNPPREIRLARIVDSKTGDNRELSPADILARNPPTLVPGDFEAYDKATGNKIDLDPFEWNQITQSDAKFISNFGKFRDIVENQKNSQSTAFTANGKLTLDLNKFLRTGDTLQISYRRVY